MATQKEMTTKEKKDRIIAFLSHFTGHFGASNLNKFLSIPDNKSHTNTHKILQDLEKNNIVEQYIKKSETGKEKGHGFRITKTELEKRNRLNKD